MVHSRRNDAFLIAQWTVSMCSLCQVASAFVCSLSDTKEDPLFLSSSSSLRGLRGLAECWSHWKRQCLYVGKLQATGMSMVLLSFWAVVAPLFRCIVYFYCYLSLCLAVCCRFFFFFLVRPKKNGRPRGKWQFGRTETEWGDYCFSCQCESGLLYEDHERDKRIDEQCEWLD